MRKIIDLLNESLSVAEVLEEMPMTAVTHLGNWDKNSGYKDQDRRLLTNPKAITKIQAQWKFPEEVDYNVILVNNAEGNRFTEEGLIGPVAGGTAREWLERNMPNTAEQIIAALNGQAVNIIYTNNKGDQRVPMTGWIMAHRFGHAIFRMGKSEYYKEAAECLSRYLKDLAEQYGIGVKDERGYGYGNFPRTPALDSQKTRNLLTQICTFKSARDNKLRNSMEALHELFAQYIFTGQIKFNDIPQYAKVGNSKYYYRGGDDYDSDNRTIQQDLSYELQSFFETAIHYASGKVFVM